jgi:hypothetical protein
MESWRALDAYNGAVGLKMESLGGGGGGCVDQWFQDWHHFSEEQDPGPS